MEVIDVPNSNTCISFYLAWSRWVGRDGTTIIEVDVGEWYMRACNAQVNMRVKSLRYLIKIEIVCLAFVVTKVFYKHS